MTKDKKEPAIKKAKTDEYDTPKWLWEPGLKVFQGSSYDLDPASSPTQSVPALRKFNKEDDGLKQDWEQSRVWLNPPFSKIKDFSEKAIWESFNGSEIILLCKQDNRTRWYWNLLSRAKVLCLVNGYVKFGTMKESFTFPICLFYLGNMYTEQFYKEYRDRVGKVFLL